MSSLMHCINYRLVGWEGGGGGVVVVEGLEPCISKVFAVEPASRV